LAWTADPVLPPITTPSGGLQFVLTLGVFATTLQKMRSTSTGGVVDAIRMHKPLLISQGPGLTW
jgi:hypothetical protein